jgi:transcriptional regulator with XRE-family HTH domain
MPDKRTTKPKPAPEPVPDRAVEHYDLLDVGAFIRSQRERTKMSVRRLAELAEVSNPYLSQIERGLRKPSAEILQQVANALRISVESLYVRAGILPDEQRSVSTVPEAIDADPYLSVDQKSALRNVYDSFRGS